MGYQFVQGEGSPFLFVPGRAQRFDLGGGVLLDQPVTPGLLKGATDDLELFVDRAGREPGGVGVPESSQVRGGDKREIGFGPFPQETDELPDRAFVFRERRSGDRALAERRPFFQEGLGALGFQQTSRVRPVDVGNHPPRLRFGQLIARRVLKLHRQFVRRPPVGRLRGALRPRAIRQREARKPELVILFFAERRYRVVT